MRQQGIIGKVRDGLGEPGREKVAGFADDTLLTHQVHSVPDLRRSLRHAREFMELLGQHGLVINSHKSKALLQLRGKLAPQALARYTTKGTSPVGKALLLPPTSIFTRNGLTIPWVDSVSYLGIVLSFENPENLTIDSNLLKAKSRYMQLRKLLTGRSSLSRQHRVKLWTTCVVPIALYGLEVTGIPKP